MQAQSLLQKALHQARPHLLDTALLPLHHGRLEQIRDKKMIIYPDDLTIQRREFYFFFSLVFDFRISYHTRISCSSAFKHRQKEKHNLIAKAC